MATIQESQLGYVFVVNKLDQAVSGGARNTQLTRGCRRLLRVACEHVLDELQSRAALWVVFQPSLSGSFCNLLSQIVPPVLVSV